VFFYYLHNNVCVCNKPHFISQSTFVIVSLLCDI
jgi:hypothetical protein